MSKNIKLSILLTFICVGVSLPAVEKKIITPLAKIGYLKSNFANPPADYRSAPLWDWNEQISEQGIDFQMKEFKKAGIGGVFIHPRPGLLTEYLSKDWFQLYNYTIQKGKELGMKVWIYDENSYPSGFAGGHLPTEMPESYNQGGGLKMEIQQVLNIQMNDTVEVVLKKTATGFTDITKTVANENGTKGTYYIFKKTYFDKMSWYGGFNYVDLLLKGVTEKFIDITMTRGYERFKNENGTTLMGVFTDEPNLESALTKTSMLRWTPDLWEAFQKRWGYDLKVNLPSLVEETGNWRKVRHDFYESMVEMFVDRWSKPWSKYCDEHQLRWTGHYWEHGWPYPTDGMDESAFYIWHQQPGVDMLGNQFDSLGLGIQWGNDRAIRELRSAANMAGRTRTLSETYGGAGWELSFESQKRLVDWQIVLGVNFVNQHLSYYSLNGVRKFDYPPSFSYHEPWWDNYKLLGDYIGRACMAMSMGEQINNTLVLQPNTTAWMYFSRKDMNPTIDKIKDGFKNFVYRMEQLHVEYDLGSENVLKELGSVKSNKLKVGNRDYSLVVIPAEMENIDTHTYELLVEFLKNGGKVLSFNPKINFLDGLASDKMDALASKFSQQWIVAEKLTEPKVLQLLVGKDFTMNDISKNGMLYHQRRVLEDGQLLFVVNTSTTKKAVSQITIKGKSVTKFDLVSGKTVAVNSTYSNENVMFPVELTPVGSSLFFVSNNTSSTPIAKSNLASETTVPAIGITKVKAESKNVLMVNYLDLKTKKTDLKDVYFMNALKQLFSENGVTIGNPWQHKIQYKRNYLSLDTLFTSDSKFTATYHFQINADVTTETMKAICAVVERPQLWQVSVNGKNVSKIDGSYWIEKEFPQYKVGEYLHAGENTITLTSDRMTIFTELMPIYLIGDFLVEPGSPGFQITEGQMNNLGSWNKNGMPFYSQKVAYSQEFEINNVAKKAYKVKLNQWSGTVAEVWVNGQKAGEIGWQPYEMDVTPYVKSGRNEITVKIIGSLKNTFGYFYKNNNFWIAGPWDWDGGPEKIPAASDYYLMNYGLNEPFELIRTNK